MIRSKWLVSVVAKALGDGARCVEVGVLRGDFSIKILEALKPSNLVLVDPWVKFSSDDYGDYSRLTQSGWDTMHSKVVKRFQEYPVEIFRGLSLPAAAAMAGRSFDFIYIDANHQEEHVLADLRAWWPMLRPGGIFSGHDLDLLTVRSAVTRFRSERGVEAPLGSTSEKNCPSWYFTKPG